MLKYRKLREGNYSKHKRHQTPGNKENQIIKIRGNKILVKKPFTIYTGVKKIYNWISGKKIGVIKIIIKQILIIRIIKIL